MRKILLEVLANPAAPRLLPLQSDWWRSHHPGHPKQETIRREICEEYGFKASGRVSLVSTEY